MNETKLTARQWRLYDYLKSQAPRKVTIKEIFLNVAGYSWHEKSDNKCPSIRLDMKAINESRETDAIIVLENQTYYFANAEELEVYRDKLFKKAMRCLRERRILKDKRNLDGRVKLLSNRDEPLTESCKDHHETLHHSTLVFEGDEKDISRIAELVNIYKTQMGEVNVSFDTDK